MAADLICATPGAPDFWPMLGPIACSRQVQRDLGECIEVRPGDAWWFAVDGSEVVGISALRIDDAGVAWLAYSWVAPEKRGAGIWRAMYEARMAEARDAGVTECRAATALLADALIRRGWAEYQRRGKWTYMTLPLS